MWQRRRLIWELRETPIHVPQECGSRDRATIERVLAGPTRDAGARVRADGHRLATLVMEYEATRVAVGHRDHQTKFRRSDLGPLPHQHPAGDSCMDGIPLPGVCTVEGEFSVGSRFGSEQGWVVSHPIAAVEPIPVGSRQPKRNCEEAHTRDGVASFILASAREFGLRIQVKRDLGVRTRLGNANGAAHTFGPGEEREVHGTRACQHHAPVGARGPQEPHSPLAQQFVHGDPTLRRPPDPRLDREVAAISRGRRPIRSKPRLATACSSRIRIAQDLECACWTRPRVGGGRGRRLTECRPANPGDPCQRQQYDQERQ